MRCALFVNTALLGLVSSLFLACSKGQLTDLNNTRNTEDLRNDRWIALEGSIVDVLTLGPGGPAGAAAQPHKGADISSLLPCWAKLEEGFPKTNVTFGPETGVATIGFLALARDNRQPGETSCRGLANITLKDVFVAAGIWSEDSVTMKNLTVADRDLFQ